MRRPERLLPAKEDSISNVLNQYMPLHSNAQVISIATGSSICCRRSSGYGGGLGGMATRFVARCVE
jgi:hypothetical protein